MSNSNKLRMHPALIPPLAALTCLLPITAHAQASLHFSPAPAPQSVAVTQSVVAPVKSAQTPEGAMLDTDPRLKQKVTLTLDNVTLSKALAQMSVKTHVSLLADGEQLQTKKLSASFVDKPLRDVLDALASLGSFEWVGRKSGAIVLRAIPAPVVEPAMEKYGDQIKGFVDKMTPEQQQALTQPYATPMASLPPDMQAAIVGAISNMHDPIGPDGQPIPMFEDMLSNPQGLNVGFKIDHQENHNFYYLSGVYGRSSFDDLVGHD